MRVVTWRAPDAEIGWPRLHPLPEMFTSSSSMPYSRTAAIGTEDERLAVFRRVRDEIKMVFEAYAAGRGDQVKAMQPK